jgi:hypothetical protein
MGGMGYASDDVVIRLSHDEALVLCELLHHWESQHRHVDARTVGPRDTPDASRTSTGPPIRSAAGLWMDSPGKGRMGHSGFGDCAADFGDSGVPALSEGARRA